MGLQVGQGQSAVHPGRRQGLEHGLTVTEGAVLVEEDGIDAGDAPGGRAEGDAAQQQVGPGQEKPGSQGPPGEGKG